MIAGGAVARTRRPHCPTSRSSRRTIPNLRSVTALVIAMFGSTPLGEPL